MPRLPPLSFTAPLLAAFPSARAIVRSSRCAMKLHSAAAERNKAAILNVLQRHLPASGSLLEVASGSGQHAAAFAAAMPDWNFQPSDPDAPSRASVDAHVADAGVRNVSPAVALDATAWPWPVLAADAVLSCNMVHISPWAATQGLMRGAGQVLAPGGALVLYGPYVIDGETAPSNVRFSESLRARNPAWGVRELRDVQKLAEENGLALKKIVPMPANNHCVIFSKPEA